jgi:hypothetical protein
MKSLTIPIRQKYPFILFTMMLLNLVSCQTEYITQHFSFPPGSKPHENDWSHTALIIVYSDESPITKRSKKKVEITVNDKSKNTLLDASFEFISSSIKASVEWEKFEDLKIELFEVGNKYAEDKYNTELIKSGPKKLMKINFRYNQKMKKFERQIL